VFFVEPALGGQSPGFLDAREIPPDFSARFIGPKKKQPHSAKFPTDLLSGIRGNIRTIVGVHGGPNSARICLKTSIRKGERNPIRVLGANPFRLNASDLVRLPNSHAVEDALVHQRAAEQRATSADFRAGIRKHAKSQSASVSSTSAILSRSVRVGSIHPLQRRFSLTGCRPTARANAIWLPNRVSIAATKFIFTMSPRFEIFSTSTPIKSPDSSSGRNWAEILV
jgi:hypothetical protein